MNVEQALQKTLGFGVKVSIKKAIEGGWLLLGSCDVKGFIVQANDDGIEVEFVCGLSDHIDDRFTIKVALEKVLLDPKFWQAVGKVEGWGNTAPERGFILSRPKYIFKMHRFIDALNEQV